MKTILNAICWTLCLSLRVSIAVQSWLHERLKNGPQARLWLARDSEVLAEAQKRGLLKKPVFEAPDACPEVELAAKAIAKLNSTPMKDALELAKKSAGALRWKKKPVTVQEIMALALKPAI